MGSSWSGFWPCSGGFEVMILYVALSLLSHFASHFDRRKTNESEEINEARLRKLNQWARFSSWNHQDCTISIN